MKLEHLGADGQPCTVHGPPDVARVLAMASLGARVPAFNHDIASKLQGVMMALDELDELVDRRAGSDARNALETAQGALAELNGLLGASRALARGAKRVAIALTDLIAQAAARTGVKLQGELPPGPVLCSPVSCAHGLSLMFDVLCGVQRTRAIEVTSRRVDETIELTFATVAPPPPHASELLLLAGYELAREGGTLRCVPAGIAVTLPIA